MNGFWISNWAHVWVGWYFCASVIMSIFLRPKIRLKWGYWRSLEVNCANFVAKVKFGNSFKYNILSSLKSEDALRSLSDWAWSETLDFFETFWSLDHTDLLIISFWQLYFLPWFNLKKVLIHQDLDKGLQKDISCYY